MNWLTNFVKPKLSALVRNRKDVPNNLWQNCPNCGNMMHHKDLHDNLHVCTSCDHHFRMPIERRIEVLFGKDNFKELKLDKLPDDPLNFMDTKKYTERLKEYRKGIDETVKYTSNSFSHFDEAKKRRPKKLLKEKRLK